MTELETYLQSVKERADAATEGDEYRVERFDNSGLFSYQIETYNKSNDLIVIAGTNEYGNMPKAKQDAEFLAKAFTDVPKLLRIIDALIDWEDEFTLKVLDKIARGSNAED